MKTKNIKRVETRTLDIKDVRAVAQETEGKRVLIGRIPYDSLSGDLGGFKEKIQRGAFNKTLNDGFDVKALVNHNSAQVLGRVKNDTLELEDREDGLYASITLGNQSYANDLWESVQRDDASSLSFGFRTIKDEFTREEETRAVIRTLKEVHLMEVSYGVTFPAYDETSTQVSFRSLYDDAGINIDTFNAALLKAATDDELTEEEIESLRALKQWIEQRVSDETQEESPEGTPLDVLERELELLNK